MLTTHVCVDSSPDWRTNIYILDYIELVHFYTYIFILVVPFFLIVQCPQVDAVGALFLFPCSVLRWVLWGSSSLASLLPTLLSVSLAGLVCHLPALPYTVFVYQQI